MTATDIDLVKDSFRKVVPIAGPAAALFYARLFELDPSLRPLFRSDLAEQGHHLMATIARSVASLERIDAPAPAIREERSATAGTALLWTLEKGLGPDFTSDVREAWTQTCALVGDGLAIFPPSPAS
jgi:hemoglobin-like flavoprotein